MSAFTGEVKVPRLLELRKPLDHHDAIFHNPGIIHAESRLQTLARAPRGLVQVSRKLAERITPARQCRGREHLQEGEGG